MLGREAVQHRDYFYSGEIGDGNGFGKRAGIGIESAAMEIDENAIALLRRNFKRSDDTYGNACDRVRHNIYRIEFLRLLADSCLPFIGANAALFECMGSCSIGFHARQHFLRFRADC